MMYCDCFDYPVRSLQECHYEGNEAGAGIPEKLRRRPSGVGPIQCGNA